VGIAIHPTVAVNTGPATGQAREDGGLEGFDDVIGRARHADGDRRITLIERGEEAVRAGTEAIATQIGVAAQRIAAVLDQQAWTPATKGGLGLESVQVAFGITLSGGVQAVFTSAVESSAQVTITLARRPGGDDDPGSPGSRR
jgi:hypothetical protein